MERKGKVFYVPAHDFKLEWNRFWWDIGAQNHHFGKDKNSEGNFWEKFGVGDGGN